MASIPTRLDFDETLFYSKCPKTEKLWLKAYTSLVWSLDTAHQILLVIALYKYCVSNYGNLLYLTRPQRILINEAVISAIIDAMVQSLLLMRAWILSNNNWLVIGALSAAILAHFSIIIAYFGQIYHFTQFTQLLSVINTERAMNAVVAAMEFFISAVLVSLLWKHRSRVRKTDSVVQRLILYTINTGLITGLWAVVALIGAVVKPDSLIYLLVDFVIPKLYVNCMLASLNARSSLREDLSSDGGLVSIHLDDIHSVSRERLERSRFGSRKSSAPRAIECRVDVDCTSSEDV
ncbi:uncharacterized protein FOMMEDRAFT_29124 [Fomitiporia mediterranea MF3/22]|uniref:uncharacterized protein n=1 Tax=Fomitiporia mediterranea (strain MF3/22) TaxID=694068 RepID=UPI00044093B6|nr:uncharacterized protein FOMMEDRAFT_29124 [Fomitiporia mediterranea MF3/22]EJD02009.1 hypothetical protein FOMMEDRAFT_29124 [Fomitiporia mediterranea MF3/22]